MMTKWPTLNAASSVVRSLSTRRKSSRDRVVREMSNQLFARGEEHVPAVGGCVNIQAEHSEFLLPEEVVLFEPSNEELFAGGVGGQNRLIFLNSPLTEVEEVALAELHEVLEENAKKIGKRGGDFPDYVRLQALRMLQYRKFNAPKTVDLIVTHLVERVKRLPISEASVLRDLTSGFMYWHGRDRKCRPCLVIRIENMGDLRLDKERAVKVVIYVLEYAIRYAMVPGRVENWVVLLDLANASKVVSFLHVASLAATGKAIATTLESVYCGRMVWMKILNMPSMLRSVVESLIPAEKKKKVQFVRDPMTELLGNFEANQLEARYGGSNPDLEPAQSYPFKFFPRARGTDVRANISTQSQHALTNRNYHEGQLWDTSSAEVKARWIDDARKAPLTTEAAEALTKITGAPADACRDMAQWTEQMQLLLRPEPQPEEDAADEDAAPTDALPPVVLENVKEEEEENEEKDKDFYQPPAQVGGKYPLKMSI